MVHCIIHQAYLTKTTEKKNRSLLAITKVSNQTELLAKNCGGLYKGDGFTENNNR